MGSVYGMSRKQTFAPKFCEEKKATRRQMLLDTPPNTPPIPPTLHVENTYIFRNKILHSAWLSDAANFRGGSVANCLHLSACN